MVMKPPSTGPTTGAIRAGQVSSAVAASRSAFRALRRTTIRPTGVISAPPRPWTARAAVNCQRLCENPQASEARVKTTMAPANTRLGPSRSATHPLNGTNAATERM